jgi:hypothetical protein
MDLVEASSTTKKEIQGLFSIVESELSNSSTLYPDYGEHIKLLIIGLYARCDTLIQSFCKTWVLVNKDSIKQEWLHYIKAREYWKTQKISALYQHQTIPQGMNDFQMTTVTDEVFKAYSVKLFNHMLGSKVEKNDPSIINRYKIFRDLRSERVHKPDFTSDLNIESLIRDRDTLTAYIDYLVSISKND